MPRILSWVDFERGCCVFPRTSSREPDAIVVSSLSLLTVLNGLRFRRRYGCRLAFEVRDIWPLMLTEEGGYSPWNPFVLGLGVIEKLGYRRADAIVGTMPNLGEHVEEVTGSPQPTYCVPMGVDRRAIQAQYRTLPDDYVAQYIPADEFVVAYAGNMGISNALDTLMKCAESMQYDPGIHFVVLGDGDLREKFENEFGFLPNLLSLRVFPSPWCTILFLGAISSTCPWHDSAVWRYGLSLNKLIDYMLAAKPIVSLVLGFSLDDR